MVKCSILTVKQLHGFFGQIFAHKCVCMIIRVKGIIPPRLCIVYVIGNADTILAQIVFVDLFPCIS